MRLSVTALSLFLLLMCIPVSSTRAQHPMLEEGIHTVRGYADRVVNIFKTDCPPSDQVGDASDGAQCSVGALSYAQIFWMLIACIVTLLAVIGLRISSRRS